MTKQPIDLRSISLILFSLGLIIAGLGVWWTSPFYPDELAFRMGNTRYIQDGYEYWGLYPFCSGRPKEVPWLLVPALWALSFVDSIFSPTQLRLLPISAVVLCCTTIAIYAHSTRNSKLFVLMSAITVGVSGSGLVLARGEHLVILQLFFCFVAIYNKLLLTYTTKVFLTLGIVFSTTCACVIHPQGLLFIPISYLALNSLINESTHSSNYRFVFRSCLLVLTCSLVITCIRYHTFSCKNIPELVTLFQTMVVNFRDINANELDTFFLLKIKKFISVFLYQEQYQVMYLPGVTLTSFFSAYNFFITWTVILLCLANVSLFFYFTGITIYKIISKKFNTINYHIVTPIFLSCIGYFLFFYDLNQYFYRTFFIHFLFITSTTLYLLNCQSRKYLKLTYVFVAIIAVMVTSSAVLNYKNFFHKLISWDAIATTPKNSVEFPAEADVFAAASACNLNLADGGLVVDAYTYEVVKRSRLLVDVYYIRFAADASKSSVNSLTEIAGISGVIASCKGMKSTDIGWPAEVSSNKICCTQFKRSPPL